ncbi:MAG TPA: GNAT family N-acetyltransferase [Candidatus Acidoferrum sp.]|nr:GNAT family N-acetyltransferase [Candidatus Acidoferrum sp.]
MKGHSSLNRFRIPRHTKTVKIHILNPLVDRRWDELVTRHPRSSVFHHRGWLKALARTYGYEPYVLTTASAGEPLENGIAVCRVSSWITGTRLVSLPFSDHCEPLLNNHGELPEFMNWLRAECDLQKWRYVELRPLLADGSGYGLQPSCSYWFHELDIRPSLEQIFRRVHNNSFRRKIQRAVRERLSFEAGHSEKLLDEFYRLLLTTRRRHQLLPQPRSWFRNLLECMGDKLQIRLTRKNGVPIAAILTLQHRSSVVYKYGCSDERFHNLGGMPFLFWRLVEESKASGAEKIDFGRTDLNNEGLIVFKDRLGTTRKLITYYRYTRTTKRGVATLRDSRAVQQFFSFLPEAVSSAASRVLYRHMG